MISNKSVGTLDHLKEVCKEYTSDKEYVFKIANDYLSKKDPTAKKWLIIMQKCKSTITNEVRYNICNKNYAKCRANELKVIAILNMNNPSLRKKYIANTHSISFGYIKRKKYKVGCIVKCDKFDWNFEEVCSGGIHYFRTLDSAYFYRTMPYNYTGKWVARYENGEKQSEGKYINGTKEGMLIEWYDNGEKQSEGTYINGTKEGIWIEWHKNGEKLCERNYINGRLNELWTKWYDNGNKKSEGKYVNGKKDGIWIEWYENGNKSCEVEYIDGTEEGMWIEWYEDGNKLCEGKYIDGEKDGIWIEWYENGNKLCEGKYINGKKDGRWTKWHENGNKSLEWEYNSNLRTAYLITKNQKSKTCIVW